MRRSGKVMCLLMGSAGLLALAGCSEDIPDVTTKAFKGVAECVQSGLAVDTCQTSFDAATADQSKNAPRFAPDKKADCETQFGAGNCETKSVQQSDGSWTDMILPAMAGYMIGNAIGNMSSPGYVPPQAMYRDRDNRYVNSGGAFVSRSMGAVIVPRGSSLRSYNGTTQLGNGRTTTVTRTTTTTTYSSSSRPSTSGTSISGRGGFGGIGGISS